MDEYVDIYVNILDDKFMIFKVCRIASRFFHFMFFEYDKLLHAHSNLLIYSCVFNCLSLSVILII